MLHVSHRRPQSVLLYQLALKCCKVLVLCGLIQDFDFLVELVSVFNHEQPIDPLLSLSELLLVLGCVIAKVMLDRLLIVLLAV